MLLKKAKGIGQKETTGMALGNSLHLFRMICFRAGFGTCCKVSVIVPIIIMCELIVVSVNTSFEFPKQNDNNFVKTLSIIVSISFYSENKVH
jgi:hypothetical protein